MHYKKRFLTFTHCGDSALTCISEWLKNTKTVSIGCRTSDDKTSNEVHEQWHDCAILCMSFLCLQLYTSLADFSSIFTIALAPPSHFISLTSILLFKHHALLWICFLCVKMLLPSVSEYYVLMFITLLQILSSTQSQLYDNCMTAPRYHRLDGINCCHRLQPH